MTRTIIVFLLSTFCSLAGFSSVKNMTHSLDSCNTDTCRSAYALKLFGHYAFKQWDSALYYADTAYFFAKRSGNDNYVGMAINNLAICNHFVGNNLKAIALFDEKYELAKKNGQLLEQASALNNAGTIYNNMGAQDKAIEYMLRSAAIREANNITEGLNKNYVNIGIFYRTQNEYQKAYDYYIKGLKLSLESTEVDTQFVANVYNNLGSLFHHQDRIDSAIYYNKIALDYRLKLKNKGEIATSMINLANAYLESESVDKCKAMMREVSNVIAGSADNAILLHYYLALSDMYKITQEHELSIQMANKGIALADSMSNLETKKSLLLNLSTVYERLNQHDKSLNYYKQYTILKDSIYNASKSKEIGKLEAKYEFEQQQIEAKRKEEIRKEKLESEKSRRDNLQYSGIFIVVLVLFGAVFLTGRFKVSEKVAEGLIFFTFLLFFEFLLVLLDPTIEGWSGGEPAYKLVLNALLAAFIFPVHAFFERMLKKRLVKT